MNGREFESGELRGRNWFMGGSFLSLCINNS